MAEASDGGEAESTDTETVTEEVDEGTNDNKEDNLQTNPEETNLEQIVEEPENLTEEQKAELNSLITESNIKVENLPNWLRAIIYAGKNILNFLSKKEYVDKKVNEYLNQNLRGKRIIVALHGTLQTYWSSWADFMEFCESKGYIVIPIAAKSPKQVANDIEQLTKRIGIKRIDRIVAHSRGGKYALDAILDHSLDRFVKELIISGAPIHYPDVSLSPKKGLLREEYAEIGKKVRLINIYSSTDQVLSFFGHANYGNLPNAINICVDMGHLDLLHNPYIFDRYKF